MAWKNYSIPLEDIKEFCKVETNAEDKTLNRISAAAIKKAETRTNREFETVPADLELAILQTILYWYENRSDMGNPPPDADQTFLAYYRWPGL